MKLFPIGANLGANFHKNQKTVSMSRKCPYLKLKKENFLDFFQILLIKDVIKIHIGCTFLNWISENFPKSGTTITLN